MTNEILLKLWQTYFNLMVLMRQTSTTEFHKASRQWQRLDREVRHRKLNITPD